MPAHLLRTVLLLLLFCVGCPETTEPPSDDDDASDDDDDTVTGDDPATATIGPDGGELSLPDGTTLVIPAGAVEEDTEFTIFTTAPEPTGNGGRGYEDQGYDRVLSPFGVSPHIFTSGDPFTFRLPTDEVPEATDPDEMVLVASGDGIADGPGGSEWIRVHPMWGPDEVGEGGVEFTTYGLSPAVYQPMVMEPDGRDHGVTDTWLHHPCSDAMTTLYDAADIPSDVDTYVRLRTPIQRFYVPNHAALGDAELQADLDEAMDRFLARTCMAVYRTRDLFDDTMGIPLPGHVDDADHPAIRTTVNWDHETGGVCDEHLGAGDGNGIIVYFNPRCASSYQGWLDAQEGLSPFNGAAPDDPICYADRLESTVAHELWHYVSDRVNHDIGDLTAAAGETLPAGGAWIEGATDAAAELAYDEPEDDAGPVPLWEERVWDIEYAMSSFWRWVDWEADAGLSDSALARILTDVYARSTPGGSNDPILGSEIDDVLADMFPDEEDYDRTRAFADFAAAYLYRHDFERDTGDGAFDGTDDVLGVQVDEEVTGELWGDWSWDGAEVCNDIDEACDPEGLEIAPAAADELPAVQTTSLDGWTARLVELDLSALADGDRAHAVLVTATDAGGTESGDLALRLHAQGSGRADEIGREHEISADHGSPTALTIPVESTAEELVLVLANVGEDSLDVEVTVVQTAERLYVLGRGDEDGALFAFDVEGESLAAVPLGAQQADSLPLSGAARSLELGGGMGIEALATGSDGWLAAFLLADGDEYEIDLDPHDGDMTRLDLTPYGATPRGIGATADGQYALVCTDPAVVLVEVATRDVVGVLDETTLGLLADERPWDVAVLPDDSKAYVTLWGWPTETDRILVLDVPEMLSQATVQGFDGLFDEYTVLGWMDAGGSETNPQVLAVSDDGLYVAATLTGTDGVAVFDTSTDALVDVAPSDPATLHFYPPDPFEPSVSPQWVGWAEDSSAVYIGYVSGFYAGRLSGNGVVRKCALAEGHCDHEVGVTYAVRSLVVLGEGDQRVIWVLDSEGLLTPLAESLFIPEHGVTVGTDPSGTYDGTGGCVIHGGGLEYIAEPCPWADEIGMSGSELGLLSTF